jgi:hypothetical protein
MDIKQALTIVAVSMMVIGYIPYTRDTITGKTKPHVFSWFIGVVVTFIAFGLQVADGAGPGRYVTLSASVIGTIILLFALQNKQKDITKSDYYCLVLAIISMILWLAADAPILSMVFVVATEVFSFVPTIRKSWHAPYSETLSSYIINFICFIIAIFALGKFTFVAIGYPLTWLLLNGGFALMLLYRRRNLYLKRKISNDKK